MRQDRGPTGVPAGVGTGVRFDGGKGHFRATRFSVRYIWGGVIRCTLEVCIGEVVLGLVVTEFQALAPHA